MGYWSIILGEEQIGLHESQKKSLEILKRHHDKQLLPPVDLVQRNLKRWALNKLDNSTDHIEVGEKFIHADQLEYYFEDCTPEHHYQYAVPTVLRLEGGKPVYFDEDTGQEEPVDLYGDLVIIG